MPMLIISLHAEKVTSERKCTFISLNLAAALLYCQDFVDSCIQAKLRGYEENIRGGEER